MTSGQSTSAATPADDREFHLAAAVPQGKMLVLRVRLELKIFIPGDRVTEEEYSPRCLWKYDLNKIERLRNPQLPQDRMLVVSKPGRSYTVLPGSTATDEEIRIGTEEPYNPDRVKRVLLD
jgi:hypothetical protein